MNKLKEKTINELSKEVLEKKEALRKFRFDTAGSKIKNVKEASVIKKEIARFLTEINKRK